MSDEVRGGDRCPSRCPVFAADVGEPGVDVLPADTSAELCNPEAFEGIASSAGFVPPLSQRSRGARARDTRLWQ